MTTGATTARDANNEGLPTMHSDLIFDVGLHIGQDTDFYLRKGFRVVAVEANPQLAEEGRARFAEAISAGRLTIVNVGIAERAGILPFYVNETLSEWSSFDHKIGTTRGPHRTLQVPTRTLMDLFSEHGVPYYVKLDIEGNDHQAICSLRATADKPHYVSLENGHKFMIDELYEQGYRRFKFVNQATIHQITLARPAREGLDIDHTFPFGSSGPFGEETPGAWQDRETVTAISEAYWNMPDRDASVHGWFDLHAAR